MSSNGDSPEVSKVLGALSEHTPFVAFKLCTDLQLDMVFLEFGVACLTASRLTMCQFAPSHCPKVWRRVDVFIEDMVGSKSVLLETVWYTAVWF